ncbi:hypothetical protein C4J81_09125 [Deltaproteobacteria bacterium Smac51]|nr:hypothetical protein C4J81_09125 [Deltaproteobacteria bacterium Smac51]
MGCQDTKTASEPAPAETAAPAAEPAVPAEAVPPPAEPEAAPAVSGTDAGLTPEFLTHQKFTLKQVNGAAYDKEMVPFIEFGENFLVLGKVCNNFRGPGELKDGVLTVREAASTRMACPDEDLSRLENSMLKMLENGARISMEGSSLFLREGDNTLIFEAAATTAD